MIFYLRVELYLHLYLLTMSPTRGECLENIINFFRINKIFSVIKENVLFHRKLLFQTVMFFLLLHLKKLYLTK